MSSQGEKGKKKKTAENENEIEASVGKLGEEFHKSQKSNLTCFCINCCWIFMFNYLAEI